MNLKLLKKIIVRMENEGFRIHVVIFDLGNKTFLHNVGFHKGNYYFQHPLDPARLVYIMPDVPHVLKLVRNHVFDHGLLVPNEDKTHLIHLDKDDFKAVLEKDNGEYKATKLTEWHLNVKNSDRQRVRPACQTLSSKVANAMRFGDDSEETKAKADAVQLFNDWFDVLDSKDMYHPNKLKCGLGVNKQEQFAVLHKMEEFMEYMEVDRGKGHLVEADGEVLDLYDPNIDHIQRLIDKKAADPNYDPDMETSEWVYKEPVVKEIKIKQPIKIEPGRKKPALIPWQHAIKCIIKTVRALFIDLVENGPLDYIMTKRLNQDLLENIFSRIRALEGSNDHPTPLGFMRRMCIIQIGKYVQISIWVNNPAVEMENENDELQEEEEIVSKFVTRDIPVAHVYELDDDETIPDCENGSTVITGVIEDVEAHAENFHKSNLGSQIEAYVAGYIAKHFRKEFDLGVKTSEVAEVDKEQLEKFPWLKMVAKTGLYMPHDEWLKDFRQFEVEFFKFHEGDLDRGKLVIDRFADLLEKKFGDKYDKSVYAFYAKFRTCMRVKALNKKSLHSGSAVTVVKHTTRHYKQLGQFET